MDEETPGTKPGEIRSRALQVQIRRATAADAPVVASVLRQAFAEYEALYTKQGYAATTPPPDQLRTRMEEGPVWVALLGGELVGTVSVVPQTEGLYIRSMAVLPISRGRGVGRLLLEESETFALASGCKGLFLSTTPFLDQAIGLYVAFGFQRTSAGPHDLLGTPLVTMEKIVERGSGKGIEQGLC